MARADYIALIDALVRDDAGDIAPAQRDDALALAVLRYAADRPRPPGGPEGGGPAPVLDEAEDTIPPGDREAVCALAAETLLDQLAARHAADTDSTIAAGAVDRRSLSARYARLAARHRARYRDLLGLDAQGRRRPRAAGTQVAPRRRRAGGA